MINNNNVDVLCLTLGVILLMVGLYTLRELTLSEKRLSIDYRIILSWKIGFSLALIGFSVYLIEIGLGVSFDIALLTFYGAIGIIPLTYILYNVLKTFRGFKLNKELLPVLIAVIPMMILVWFLTYLTTDFTLRIFMLTFVGLLTVLLVLSFFVSS